MKYIVILGDGMADYPVEALGGKTPLEAANKPFIDGLASKSVCGIAKTVPAGMSPGSDTANLSVMGYDPKVYYSGRSPLEAVSMGIDLGERDVTYRCNTVTLSDGDTLEDLVMLDHSSDEISTEESREFILELNELFKTDKLNIYPGISYRHCLVLRDAEAGAVTVPPHDILGQQITQFFPRGINCEMLMDMTRRSFEHLKDHPLNKKRREKGLNPVSALWFWGEGRKPALSSFMDKFGKSGAVVSAVDLIKGIGICAGLRSIEVEGATGNIHTNFEGKAEASVEALLGGLDFVYIHIEAPDECGHRNEIENKVKSIEYIDSRIVKPIAEKLTAAGEEFCMLVTPDHPTPVMLRTHTSEPVPFFIYRSGVNAAGVASYTENLCGLAGLYVEAGHTLLDLLFEK